MLDECFMGRSVSIFGKRSSGISRGVNDRHVDLRSAEKYRDMDCGG